MSIDQKHITTLEPAALDRKQFTVAEANRSLPYVARVVDDVMSVYKRIVDLRRGLEDIGAGDESLELERDYERSMDRLGELVDELHMVGVELKDFEKGLIDFPAEHNGREILLCWQQGEQAVTHWHEIDAGFGGRQTVEALEP